MQIKVDIAFLITDVKTPNFARKIRFLTPASAGTEERAPGLLAVNRWCNQGVRTLVKSSTGSQNYLAINRQLKRKTPRSQ